MTTIRADAPEGLEAFYAAAFPEEDLSRLVRDLAASPEARPLAAYDGEQLIGHAFFTLCGVDDGPSDEVALLGPLAVAPGRQRSGVGSALIRAGLEKLRKAGVRQVLVLGDPAYYGRFGFATEDGVRPPYPLPEDWREAWRSLSLDDDPPSAGALSPPKPWLRPELWAA